MLGYWDMSLEVRYPLVEIAVNALIFAPLGALWIARVRHPRGWRAVAPTVIAVGVVVAAEYVDARYLPARIFEPRDMFADTLAPASARRRTRGGSVVVPAQRRCSSRADAGRRRAAIRAESSGDALERL